jgi:hypothetical protein
MKRWTWLTAAALIATAALIGCGGSETATEPGSDIPGVAPGPGGGAPGAGGGADFSTAGNIPSGYPAPKAGAPGTEGAAEPAKETAEAPKAEGEAPPPAEPPKTEEPKAEGEAAAVTLSAEEIAEIKNLPEADQAAALKQKVCPISSEHLGSMGTPIKVTVGDKSAFLCCEGCKEDFDKDPQAALAKLGLK